MIYIYKCEQCKKEIEINKSMFNVDRIEHCEKCGRELKRVYQSGMIKTSDGTKW